MEDGTGRRIPGTEKIISMRRQYAQRLDRIPAQTATGQNAGWGRHIGPVSAPQQTWSRSTAEQRGQAEVLDRRAPRLDARAAELQIGRASCRERRDVAVARVLCNAK